MDKRDYYLLKDVLFGLRNEYQKVEEKLRELKQFAEIDKNNSKVEDFYFWVHKLFEGDVPKINCELVMKDKKELTQEEIDKLMLEENTNPHIIIDEKYPIYIRYDNQEIFTEKTKEILNLEFIKKICMENITKEDFYQILELYPESIHLYDGSLTTKLNYHSYNDTVSMVSDKYTYLSNELVENLLNIKLKNSMFSEYHQNVIETSNTFGKNIRIIGEIEKSRQSKFAIEEDEKQLVLRKL